MTCSSYYCPYKRIIITKVVTSSVTVNITPCSKPVWGQNIGLTEDVTPYSNPVQTEAWGHHALFWLNMSQPALTENVTPLSQWGSHTLFWLRNSQPAVSLIWVIVLHKYFNKECFKKYKLTQIDSSENAKSIFFWFCSCY